EPKSGAQLWYDQRELTLKFLISVEKIKKFFHEGLAQGKLLATQCKKCGRIYFPPQVDCPHCKTSEMEWIELPKEGELVTYTIITTRPYSFGHYPDYTVGVVKLKNGVQITAWIRETDPKKLRVGMPVKLEIVKREPEGYYTYEFVPIKEE
ncbi:MAG: Zn-ribbon domain-containing OB-fold protein, partial [Desulfurococcales archaeon]|nr:Zn-ribbon domain-containing OB-fold protein [Desulfurococcales archaeon]